MAEFVNRGPMLVKPYAPVAAMFERACGGARTVYDHGCGYGGWTEYVLASCAARVAAFDPDPKALAHTRRLIGDRWLESDGPFDVILCFAVLELLPADEQRRLLADFRRRLTGQLLIQYNVYNPWSLRWLLIRLVGGEPKAWHERRRFHRSYLTHREVEALFAECGFEVAERQAPAIENHLPRAVNRLLAPLFPMAMHSTIYYRLVPQGTAR